MLNGRALPASILIDGQKDPAVVLELVRKSERLLLDTAELCGGIEAYHTYDVGQSSLMCGR